MTPSDFPISARRTDPLPEDAVIRPLVIGGITLPNNLILAPMAGVCDLPFRLLCREQGAGLVCMEMISAKALFYRNPHTKELLEIDLAERPVSLQLFGSDPECIGEIARRIDDLPFDFLDLNMGCPVPKIVKNGDGSALMRNPVLAGRVIEAAVRGSSHPVTVKIRKGFDDEHINAPEIARIAEQSGARAIAVHGRTREEYYSGQADYGIIAAVRDAVTIPVIGNGDITSPEDVIRMQRETGCDGFMIGRGAQGNPWIFSEILSYFGMDGDQSDAKRYNHPDGEHPTIPPRTIAETTKMMLRHAKMLIDFKGEYIGIREMRKHAAWYTAGFPDSAAFRRKVNEVTDYAGFEQLVLSLDNRCKGKL